MSHKHCKHCQKDHKNYQEQDEGNFSGGMMVGALVGFFVAVFLLPPQGEKNRKKLKKASEAALEQAEKYGTPVVEEMKKVYEENKDPVKEHVGEIVETIANLAELPWDEIKERIKKGSKNASSTGFFRGSL